MRPRPPPITSRRGAFVFGHGVTRRAWLASDGPAIEAAELYDDVTLLRERYPHIARFIHPMKLPRGPHRPSPRRQAIDYAFRVKAAERAGGA
jgi:hypothetical protein